MAMASGWRGAFLVAVCPALMALTIPRASGPYDLGFRLSSSARGYRVLPWNFLDDVNPSRKPSAWPDPVRLETFGTPGEYEPLSFVIYADRALAHVAVKISALRGPSAAIPVDSIALRWVWRGPERVWGYGRASNTEVVSRFLLDRPDVDLGAQTLRQVYVSIHLPKGIPAGAYKGKWMVQPQNGQPTTIDVGVTVLPFELGGTGGRQYGVYYTFRNLGQVNRINRELADIHAHGANTLIPTLAIAYKRDQGKIVPEYAKVTRGLRMMGAHGFHGTVPITTGFQQLAKLLDVRPGSGVVRPRVQHEFDTVGKKALEGLLAIGKRFPEFQIVGTQMDEVTRSPQLMSEYIYLTRIARQVPQLPMMITLSHDPTPRVARMLDRVGPYVNIRSYSGYTVGDWLRAGHTFGELATELKNEGDVGWVYYNVRGAFFRPVWTWLVNSYYMWMSPFKAHVPWIYYHVHGNPLDDTDGPVVRGHDYGYAVPSPNGGKTIISTLDWEAYRDGIQNIRYLAMLDSLTRKARTEAPSAAAGAEAWLKRLHGYMPKLPRAISGIRGESPVLRWFANKYSGKDYEAWRKRTADEIMKLQAALAASHGQGATEPVRARIKAGDPAAHS